LTVEVSEEVLDDHKREYKMDTIVGPKQVIYWPNFITGRKEEEEEEDDDDVSMRARVALEVCHSFFVFPGIQVSRKPRAPQFV
jgi:hypothetical protein